MRPERAPRVNINQRIRATEIRVIDEDGTQLGVMTPADGIARARAKGLDLVEVAPGAVPPVCRIIDFGKWQYEQKKKANEAKKKQTTIQVKEIKFRPGTDEHDYDFKKVHAARILRDGDKVKATVHFRGREITHKELGQQLLARLVDELKDDGQMEVEPKLEGMNMFAIIAPRRSNTPKPKQVQVEQAPPAQPIQQVQQAPPVQSAEPAEPPAEPENSL